MLHRIYQTIVILLIFLVPIVASPQSVSLHPDIGSIVDSSENSKYKIIKSHDTFIYGAFYQEATGNIRLHTLCKTEGGYYWRVKKINLKEFIELRNNIAKQLSNPKDSGAQYLLKLKNAKQITDSSLVSLKIKKEQSLFGSIVGNNKDTVLFESIKGDTLKIPDKTIYRVSQINYTLEKNEVYLNDVAYSKLFISPTAKNIPKGNFQIINIMGLFNAAAYGISDNISIIAGGLPGIMAVGGFKTSFNPTDNLSLGAGGLYNSVRFSIFGDPEIERNILFYLNSTLEIQKVSLTLSGYFSSIQSNFFAITGVQYRNSKRTLLMNETVVQLGDDEQQILISNITGMRIIFAIASLDLGVLTSFEEDDVQMAPAAGLTFRFGVK